MDYALLSLSVEFRDPHRRRALGANPRKVHIGPEDSPGTKRSGLNANGFGFGSGLHLVRIWCGWVPPGPGVRRYRGSAVEWGCRGEHLRLWQSLPSGIRQGARRTPSRWSRSSHTIALAAAASRGFWQLPPGNLLGSQCVPNRPLPNRGPPGILPLAGVGPSVGLGSSAGAGTSHGWLLSRRPAIMGKINSSHKLDTA